MKINYILIALAMVAALTMVSCKNNKKTQSQEPTQEEVQEMKQALADSVLAEIDAIVDEYCIAFENDFRFRGFELTEAEKLIKPDYLLDPSVSNELITKSQKINAIAFYMVDLGVRILYDMPVDEAKETIAKLASDVNIPIDLNDYDINIPRSERTRNQYNMLKENEEVTYFWQFHNAAIKETYYIIVQNPELFFSKITEEQWQQYVKRTNEKNKAMRELAKYDEEMAAVLEIFNQNRVVSSDEEKAKVSASIETHKRHLIANKDKFIENRNALLQ